jgi:hypothetical protein
MQEHFAKVVLVAEHNDKADQGRLQQVKKRTEDSVRRRAANELLLRIGLQRTAGRDVLAVGQANHGQ